jgi:hypothetical protein
VRIGYDAYSMLGMFGESNKYKEANAVFVLKGATATVKTNPVWFCIAYGPPDRSCFWFLGRLADQLPGTLPQMPKIMPKE